jgi:hypothetical protein
MVSTHGVGKSIHLLAEMQESAKPRVPQFLRGQRPKTLHEAPPLNVSAISHSGDQSFNTWAFGGSRFKIRTIAEPMVGPGGRCTGSPVWWAGLMWLSV